MFSSIFDSILNLFISPETQKRRQLIKTFKNRLWEQSDRLHVGGRLTAYSLQTFRMNGISNFKVMLPKEDLRGYEALREENRDTLWQMLILLAAHSRVPSSFERLVALHDVFVHSEIYQGLFGDPKGKSLDAQESRDVTYFIGVLTAIPHHVIPTILQALEGKEGVSTERLSAFAEFWSYSEINDAENSAPVSGSEWLAHRAMFDLDEEAIAGANRAIEEWHRTGQPDVNPLAFLLGATFVLDHQIKERKAQEDAEEQRFDALAKEETSTSDASAIAPISESDATKNRAPDSSGSTKASDASDDGGSSGSSGDGGGGD